jgi:hypothetical protein
MALDATFGTPILILRLRSGQAFPRRRLCRNDEPATHVILNEVKNLMYSILRQHRFFG